MGLHMRAGGFRFYKCLRLPEGVGKGKKKKKEGKVKDKENTPDPWIRDIEKVCAAAREFLSSSSEAHRFE